MASGDLVGTYRGMDEGLTISLRPDPNRRLEQRVHGLRADFDGAELAGRWRIEGNTLYFFEEPARAPEITLVESKRDPSVRMHVEVREQSGRGARDVFVGEVSNANPQAQLDYGVLKIPLHRDRQPGVRQIVRKNDGLRVTSFKVTADGPNVFRFEYQPSGVEPFKLRSYAIDAQGQAIAIPLGMSRAILRRVPARN